MGVTHWLLAGLALAAAGCLDSGGGPVAEDQPVEHDHDGVPDAEDCAPYDSGLWELLPAYVDQDRDGYGAGAQVTSCFGDGRSLPGFSIVGTDCDDTEYAVWQLMDRFADADHDGVGAGERVSVCGGSFTPAGYADSTGDCSPDDVTRWLELGYVYRDGDLDGYTVPSPGVVCSGAALPAGYRMEPSGVDCNDDDDAAFVAVDGYPDGDADGYGVGTPATFCTGGALPPGYATASGDCAPTDGSKWLQLAYAFVDLDADGYTVASMGTLCTGGWLPDGYRATPSALGTDCDDANSALLTLRYGYADADADGYGAGTAESVCAGPTLPSGWVATGTDCEPTDPSRWRPYAYTQRDADADGYTVPESGSVCAGAENPAGYGTVATSYYPDCDDADASLYGLRSGFADADGDGYGVLPRVSVCSGSSLPAGYVTNSTDCAADDAAAWRSSTYAYVDRDADGFTVRESGSFCYGDVLPAPYLATANGNDCDEADPALYRWVVLYEDKDGDGVGAPPRWIPCLGATLPDGWSIFGFDEDDTDTAVQASTADEVLFTILD